METSKSLRRPANWQDFETLCKKLWGEVWNCPEIKKNGRSGQSQHGVDVYGIPFGETMYYGIQCKGKDEYSSKELNPEEVNQEIEKALKFQPALKKLYFATTAVKDATIEEFIRIKNLEHIKNNLFEVHLFSWEDIVDLIDEHKQTHDWYVKSQNYKANKSVKVSFKGGLLEIWARPKYKKMTHNYVLSPPKRSRGEYGSIFYSNIMSEALSSSKTYNHSYIKFDLRVYNTGNDPIEEYKLFISFEGDLQDLSKQAGAMDLKFLNKNYNPTTFLWADDFTGRLVPLRSILVSGDTFISEDIYLKPSYTEKSVLLNWKLISKDFKENGQLKINLDPLIEEDSLTYYVDHASRVGIEEQEISDYTSESDFDNGFT